MKHYTLKQVIKRSNHFIYDRKARMSCVKPDSDFGYEFITIGNRNPVTMVFIKSPLLNDVACLGEHFGLSHPQDSDGSIIQYNSILGGYLYTWLKLG